MFMSFKLIYAQNCMFLINIFFTKFYTKIETKLEYDGHLFLSFQYQEKSFT